ncbi:hypothetical protein Tco_0809200, partial [Tanacetum coccineum]
MVESGVVDGGDGGLLGCLVPCIDTEDPSWNTSFKTRRTQKTSSALEDFICVIFVPDRNIVRCNLAKSLSIYVLPGQSTNFITISNASAFPTLDANAGDDELVGREEQSGGGLHLGVIDQFCFAYTIGLTDAELKEDRLKDDRVHGLSIPSTLNK